MTVEKYNILNGQQFPDAIVFEEIDKHLSDEWKKYFLVINQEQKSVDTITRMFKIIKMDGFYASFNDRVSETRLTYKIALFHYQKGIPDDPYYESAFENGYRGRYFPLFTEERHFVNLFWFTFYAEYFYTKFQGIIDYLHHVINKHYDLGVASGSGFNSKVQKKLKDVNKQFFKEISEFRNSEFYKELNTFRNDIIHNEKPGKINSFYTKHENGTESYGIGDYTNSNTIIENMENNIIALAKYMDRFKLNLVI